MQQPISEEQRKEIYQNVKLEFPVSGNAERIDTNQVSYMQPESTNQECIDKDVYNILENSFNQQQPESYCPSKRENSKNIISDKINLDNLGENNIPIDLL